MSLVKCWTIKRILERGSNIVCYLIKTSPQASVERNVAKEVWNNNLIDLDHLRIFRCPAYVHISKLNSKSKKCVFVDYAKGMKRFKKIVIIVFISSYS